MSNERPSQATHPPPALHRTPTTNSCSIDRHRSASGGAAGDTELRRLARQAARHHIGSGRPPSEQRTSEAPTRSTRWLDVATCLLRLLAPPGTAGDVPSGCRCRCAPCRHACAHPRRLAQQATKLVGRVASPGARHRSRHCRSGSSTRNTSTPSANHLRGPASARPCHPPSSASNASKHPARCAHRTAAQ